MVIGTNAFEGTVITGLVESAGKSIDLSTSHLGRREEAISTVVKTFTDLNNTVFNNLVESVDSNLPVSRRRAIPNALESSDILVGNKVSTFEESSLDHRKASTNVTRSIRVLSNSHFQHKNKVFCSDLINDYMKLGPKIEQIFGFAVDGDHRQFIVCINDRISSESGQTSAVVYDCVGLELRFNRMNIGNNILDISIGDERGGWAVDGEAFSFPRTLQISDLPKHVNLANGLLFHRKLR